MTFPIDIETKHGGQRINSPEHLRRLAKEKAGLSNGFVLSTPLVELLPIVERALRKAEEK